VLQALFITIPFIVAIFFALGLCMLTYSLYFNAMVGIWLVLSLFVWETMTIALPGIKLGIVLYPQDLAFGLIAIAAVLRLLSNERLMKIPKSWAFLGLFMLGSFTWGLATNGTAAGVDFRADFYFFAGTVYFLSFPVTRQYLSCFARAWLVTAVVILFVVYYRWIADVLDLDWIEPLWRTADATGVAFRVVYSMQAFFLGQALILLVYAMATGSGLRNWRFLVPFFGITVIVLQHRSVWGAVLIPILLSFVLVGKARGRLVTNLAVIGLISAVALVPLLAGGGLSSVTNSVVSSAQHAASTSEGTFVARVNGWQQLLGGWLNSGPVGYAVGKPYGSGYTRYETETRKVEWAPHNYYVQTLLRTGLFGLVALLSTYFIALRWLKREENFIHSEVPASVFFALLVAQLLYYIPYSPHYVQTIILGFALSLVRGTSIGWRQPTLLDAKP